MSEKAWPAWVPIKLKDWLKRLRENDQPWEKRKADFAERVALDPRMRDFWEWLSTASDTARLPILVGPHSVLEAALRASSMPGKPGNLTPGERSAYFKKVRKHTHALMELLQGTRFDQASMYELEEVELDQPLSKKLYSWGDDESDEGHVVAFVVAPDGVFEMPYTYPSSHLVHALYDLCGWTEWDDQWDGNPLKSSDPISHANSSNAPAIYFTRVMFEKFNGQGVDVPFTLLATLANVVLQLPSESQMDEDTVRKQVRRYQDRMAKLEAARIPAF